MSRVTITVAGPRPKITKGTISPFFIRLKKTPNELNSTTIKIITTRIEMITSNILKNLGSLILNITDTEIRMINNDIAPSSAYPILVVVEFVTAAGTRINIDTKNNDAMIAAKKMVITAEAMTITFFIDS